MTGAPVAEPQPSYWHHTDSRIAREVAYDSAAGRIVNAAWAVLNRPPLRHPAG